MFRLRITHNPLYRPASSLKWHDSRLPRSNIHSRYLYHSNFFTKSLLFSKKKDVLTPRSGHREFRASSMRCTEPPKISQAREQVPRRIALVIVGVFTFIYGGHWYVTSKDRDQRSGQIMVDKASKQANSDFMRWFQSKQQQPQPSNPTATIEHLFSTPMLAHRVKHWPPNLQDWQSCFPFAASMWSHFNLWHLLLNSQALIVIMPQAMMVFGIGRTITAFVASGVLGTALQCTVDKAYAQGQHAEYFRFIKARPRDPHPDITLQNFHLGASGALCGLLAILELARPAFRPAPFTAVFLAFTCYGFYAGQQAYPAPLDRIGHSGHLAGLASGAALWFGWLRWIRLARSARPF